MKNLNPHNIQTCDETAHAYGVEIAETLKLKKVKVSMTGHFYDTTWGHKSAIGLARIIHTIVTTQKVSK